jgi:hypothetical protein
VRVSLKPHARLPRVLGAYLLAIGAAGLGGLALAIGDLSLADGGLSVASLALPLVAGWQLWRRGWGGWRWGLASQLPQVIEVATGTRLFRLVLGFYWKVRLAGTPPQTGLGFSIGVTNPAPQTDLGRWVSLDLLALALAAGFLVGPRMGQGRPPEHAGAGAKGP